MNRNIIHHLIQQYAEIKEKMNSSTIGNFQQIMNELSNDFHSEILDKNPILVYYDYCIRNPKRKGYYRDRLINYLSSNNQREHNPYLFTIKHRH